MPPVLVAPDAFAGSLRAVQVAAALVRGLEDEGWEVDHCPLADGGPGTLEALLLGLGGDTAAATIGAAGAGRRRVGFGLLGGGGTAIVEAAAVAGGASGSGAGEGAIGGRRGGAGEAAATSAAAGELVGACARTGAEVIVLAPGGARCEDEGVGAAEALDAAGGLRGARLIVLDPGGEDAAAAAALASALEGRLEAGARFVLDALGYDERMLEARCVVVGAARLDERALRAGALAEASTRARQSGVPCNAVVGVNALDRFGARILDLQAVLEASTVAQLRAAGRELARII